jgi:hypothetical protein
MAGLISVSVHAAFGGAGPRWQPLNGADRHALLARCQSESVLAGGNGDGGTKLRPDGYGARLSAGDGSRGRQPVAAEERTGFVGDGCQICYCIRLFHIGYLFGLFHICII